MQPSEQKDRQPLLDADAVLDVTERLHSLRVRVAEASVTEERRERWQQKLLDLTAAAQRDISTAAEQLTRFERELDRALDDRDGNGSGRG